ncbi:MAG TPA: DUF1415 domain-containing protein [Ramlibacter sp.]|nr:DUF1415 domain-containing protein [Ramlibacter sp.]
MEQVEQYIAGTQAWIERAVIGLNLCPFARSVHAKRQIHYAISAALSWQDLLEELGRELDALLALPPQQRETTLLIVPHLLDDFLQFNDFLRPAQKLLDRRGLEGIVQLASFHPDYQFTGCDADDPANFSNRAPWPTLHLLREDSVARAVQALPRPQAIYEANIETLRRLGPDGWAALDVGRR